MASSEPSLTLYTFGTPNGVKIPITLEELHIPYKVHVVDITKNMQKEEWFLKINPNGRIPALVDHSRSDFCVFESGAIMVYLCEQYDREGKLMPKDPSGRSEVMQWLMFQISAVGPMQGQANHFFRFAPEKIEYGIRRYQAESRRLYEVLERRLSTSDWLAANQFTIADIANFCWVRIHAWAGISIDGLPHLTSWLKRIQQRPEVQKGLNVPTEDSLTRRFREDKDFKDNDGKEDSVWFFKE
eukprot:TRINITY_DN1416_c0_g1_i1.p1 TRINITY_DN1416_c0_g1~~TRINITY_DN1416_c0_g1_i1.p1  ORF type:complete len:242 (+),score=45.61 TRINITY_DN1416_c0_g1_i1:144-869(+)